MKFKTLFLQLVSGKRANFVTVSRSLLSNPVVPQSSTDVVPETAKNASFLSTSNFSNRDHYRFFQTSTIRSQSSNVVVAELLENNEERITNESNLSSFKKSNGNNCHLENNRGDQNLVKATTDSAKLNEKQQQHEKEKEKPLFKSISSIPEPFQKSLERVFKYSEMSSVQSSVLSLLPSTTDMLVKAKTGTGKTLAFLLAALHQIDMSKIKHDEIPIVIVAPTRELANQIQQEAYKLMMFTSLKCHIAVGGASKQMQKNRFIDGPCSILVATPGRLLDLLGSEPKLRHKLSKTKTFVLDEVDRLMDQGFYVDIQKISEMMPQTRQNLFFSATSNKKTKEIISETMKPNHVFIDCVPENEANTHLQIKQTAYDLPLSKQFPFLLQTITEHKKENPDAKILVFFPTATMVQYAAELFNRVDGMNVLEIHSKLQQASRERVSFRFRAASSAVMFTTDVSARGVDYPNVSLVVQVGAPQDQESYIHRIGRTGRAGKHGEAKIILAPFERRFLEEVKSLPIRVLSSIAEPEEKFRNEIWKAIEGIPTWSRASVFLPWFVFYRGNMSRFGISNDTFVKAGSQYAKHCLKLDKIPPLNPKFVREAKLHGYSEITVANEFSTNNSGPNFSLPLKQRFSGEMDSRANVFNKRGGQRRM